MSRSSTGTDPPRWRPAVLLLGVAMLAGCTSSPGANVGAPTATPARGPTIVAAGTLPPLIARTTPSGAAPATAETAVGGLAGLIGQALVHNGDRTPAVLLSQKAAAGNQVIVRWTLGSQYPDPGARDRVRTDVVTVLDIVRRSNVRYGSVLLLATGVSSVNGRKKVSIVVRAKYTQGLVRDTDWSQVSPGKVLGMCDDKPAVIAAGYR